MPAPFHLAGPVDDLALAVRRRAADVDFLIPPGIRSTGRVGEQATMSFRDPAGNALECNAFRDSGQLFAP